MGVFHELVTLVNRAPVSLTVRFDGQDTTIYPGENQIPKIAITCAKNQNPIMGSADADNPSMRGARYLIGVKDTEDDCTPLTKEEWQEHLGKPSRMNVDDLIVSKLDPKKERLVVRGRKAPSAFEVRERVSTEFGSGD